MNWISVNDKLPICWSQHGDSFASGYLLTCDKYGEYEINQYWKHGKHTGKGWIQNNEGWEEMDGEITHWCKIESPKK
jgi:hypothetical protein